MVNPHVGFDGVGAYTAKLAVRAAVGLVVNVCHDVTTNADAFPSAVGTVQAVVFVHNTPVAGTRTIGEIGY